MTTKFNIREYVYFVYEGKIHKGEIRRIETVSFVEEVPENGIISIEKREFKEYWVREQRVTCYRLKEEDLFSSREELLETLKNN